MHTAHTCRACGSALRPEDAVLTVEKDHRETRGQTQVARTETGYIHARHRQLALVRDYRVTGEGVLGELEAARKA